VLYSSHASSWKLRQLSWVKSFDDKSGPQLLCCLLHVVAFPLISLLLNWRLAKCEKHGGAEDVKGPGKTADTQWIHLK